MDLSSVEAAEVIGVAERTIRYYVERGILPARRVGLRRMIRINVSDLRRFADEYEFIIDEDKLRSILGD